LKQYSDVDRSALASLTAEQRDALRLAAEGYTSKEIGRLLGVSHYAVNTRLDRVRAALGASSRNEAVRLYRACDAITYDPADLADTYDPEPVGATDEEHGASHRLNDRAVDLQRSAVQFSWRMSDGPLARLLLIILCAIGFAVAAQVAFGLYEAGNPAALRLVQSIRSLF
jgi:DNA-binding CsgD family transcriptional regulator